MMHSNNTMMAARCALPHPVRMLLGILSLSACLAPAPAASQDDEAHDKSAESQETTPGKPEISISDMERQLFRYHCVNRDAAWKFIDHLQLVQDELEKKAAQAQPE